jgi:glycerol-3-phosphate O-acyltransferase 1/2
VPTEDVEMIREAERKGLPLIFLPLHRSHLDYILLTFVLMNNGIKAPIVAAGDNLIIPVFGLVLQYISKFILIS